MINIIVACDRNNLIGKNGKLPWDIKEDWEYFMQKTETGTMIMGRTCFQEFEPLANQRNVIALTRDRLHKFKSARTAHSLNQAISLVKNQPIWICGGEDLYREAIPLAHRLYITEIDEEFSGNVHFPEWQSHFKKLISRKKIDSEKYSLEFLVYEKV